jgi:CheY-like chemotaxis protein
MASHTRVRPGRVLLIDDEPLFLRMLDRTLALDHYVESYTSAREALAAVARERFDVILCDINMPEMDGPTFFANVELLSPDDARRIVFMTGDRMAPHTAAFVARVPNFFLDKPFELEDLLELIDRRVRTPTGSTGDAR